MFDESKARATIEEFQNLLDETSPEVASIRLSPESWTLNEIIGHLVDSASNNHQRFVRLRFGDLGGFPAYDAEPWIEKQSYDDFGFENVALLWTSLNQYLLLLLTNTPEEAFGNTWSVSGKSNTLLFLMNDYYDHMQLHVDHYRERLKEISAM